MTTQTVHIQTYDYGASLTSATLRAIDTDALVATADATGEVTADSGLYAVVFGQINVPSTLITAGTYRLRAIAGGQPINRYATLTGVDAEVVQSRSERFAELPPNGITATVLATNSITAAALASDAVTEIQSGLATQTSVDAIQSDTDNIQTRLPAALEGGRMAAVLDSAGRLAIWNTLTTESFTADSFGELIIISDGTNGREVKVTASGHMAADVHDVQPDGLSASTEIIAINTFASRVTTGIVQDGVVWQFTANMLELGPSGSGGDATLAKQEEILAAIQGTEVIQVASPNVQGNLVLTQGDSYDGIANPKATWTVTTDYTSGWTVLLTIRDKDDAVIYTTSGTVVNSTTITVTIAAPTGLDMTGCPGQWQGKFDVQLTKAGSIKTIALGTCYINEDQTR